MQPLTAAPREMYSAEEVLAALSAPDQVWGYGVERLEPDLSFIEDISADVSECTVSHDSGEVPHGSIEMVTSRELAWGVDRIKPYALLSVPSLGISNMRFNLGVYILQSPEPNLAESPRSYRVAGQDQLSLLQYYATQSWAAIGGDNVLDGARAVLTAAGIVAPVQIDSSASAATVPATGRVWPMIRGRGWYDDSGDTQTSYRWLEIANDYLTMISYTGLWADWDGVIRSGPTVDPMIRPIEYAFDVDDDRTNVVSARTSKSDLWDAYNRMSFYMSGIDGDPVEGSSQYTWNNLDVGPASQLALKMVRKAPPQAITVSTYDALKAAGDAMAAEQATGKPTVSMQCSKLPILWQRDVASLADGRAGAARWRMASQSWSLALHDASDQTVEWEVVSDAA